MIGIGTRLGRNPSPACGARRVRSEAISTNSWPNAWPATRIAEPFIERFTERGLVLDVRANHMPGGGIVTTFTDVTPSFEAAEALERRVAERTTELTLLNGELVRAKADAEEANISKTRFLAAASHDILQPLNAARLT